MPQLLESMFLCFMLWFFSLSLSHSFFHLIKTCMKASKIQLHFTAAAEINKSLFEPLVF